MPIIKINKATMRLQKRRIQNAARKKAVKNETRRRKRLDAASAIQAQSGIIPAVNSQEFFNDEGFTYKVASKFCKFVKKLKNIDAREHNTEARNKIDELKFDITNTLLTKFGKKGVESPGKNNAMNAAVAAVAAPAVAASHASPTPRANNISAFNDNLEKLLEKLTL